MLVGWSIHKNKAKKPVSKGHLGAEGTRVTWLMLSLLPSYCNAHFDLHIAVVLISIFDEVIHNQITK